MADTRPISQSYHAKLERLRAAFARGRLPRPMANPPTVTQSATQISGTLKTSSASDFGPTGKHRYVGGQPYKIDSAGTDWVKFRTVSFSADGTAFNQVGGSVEFVTNAPIFTIQLGGNTTPFRLWCEEDGELRLISAAMYHVASATPHVIVDFTTQSTTPTARRLRVDFGVGGAGGTFQGITTSALHDVWKPFVSNPLRCIVAGDSFVEGTTADGAPTDVLGLDGLANHMGWHLGLDDVWSSGSGGTGWMQTNGSRVSLNSRFQRDVMNQMPDLAVVAMGVNDGSQNAALIQSSVATSCNAFRDALPASPLIIVAPWSPKGSQFTTIRTAITAGARAEVSGRTFVIDPREAGAEWQSTTPGQQEATTGQGNGDWLIDSGGTHPSIAGHAYLGMRLANAIKQALMN